MITVMDSQKEQRRKPQKCLDSQLWHACAGGMVQMPPVNSKVFYFPQGHAEHARGSVDFGNSRIPPLIPCRVSTIQYLADPETDEVYAKMRLIPLRDCNYFDDDGGVNGIEFDGIGGVESQEKPVSFAKTLTQSDANNGGGFSVPRYCAETIFPRLDCSAEPPVQTILAKDVHGETWKFRHIYRGTPRRHLLTTGWSNFVNQKKLAAGDSIVFLRVENGDLYVGIRRAKRGIGGGFESPAGWNSMAANGGDPFGGYSSMFVSESEGKPIRKNFNADLRGKVRIESFVEAATLASNFKPFEVVYYPRASTPEFCVKASSVRAAIQIRWCSGMRFKMAFETEDSSRISWFVGTISSVQVVDPICWPSSPWGILQVAWDEPDLLEHVKRVNPWLVELVSNMPTIPLSPFSPPRKKLRLTQHSDFSSFMSQLLIPTSNPLASNSPLCCLSEHIPTGIQGARHGQFGPPSDLHYKKLQLGLFPVGFEQLDCAAPTYEIPSGNCMGTTEKNGGIPCLLTIGSPPPISRENNETKTPHFFLFGQLILPEQQNSQSCSGDTTSRNTSLDGNLKKMVSDGSGSAVLENGTMETLSDEGSLGYKDHRKADLGLETGHCKVFMESDDVARTLDLSVLSSYEELYGKLASMFGLSSLEMLSGVLYWDAAGTVKHPGDEPFSKFLKTARRLTILRDSSSNNIMRVEIEA